ncbi:MAG: hybrid sensor histidine kinase/response regulator, partial [Pseudomonadales bacterium]
RMPGSMDGVALARWMSTAVPTVRVLLMSGFSELDVADSDLPLIRKPFTATKLMRFIGEHGA